MKRAHISREEFAEVNRLDWNLWMRWIFANTLGELIGLGAVAVTGVLFFYYLDKNLGAWSAIATAFLMIPVGAFEGFIVGHFQSKVLQTKIAEFNSHKWIFATVVGAVTAWILGTIPSLLMAFAENSQNSHQKEMSEIMMGASAAGMGFALGIVLGFPQWLELRRYVKNAGWWILANALAWTIGMPQLFAAPGIIGEGFAAWQIAFIIFTAIVSAGASVGAIHGLFLIWLLKTRRD